jgi:hypothetical protein
MILIILSMLFSVPIFDTNTYINPPNSYTYGLYVIAAFDYNSDLFNKSMNEYVNEEKENVTPLIYATALNATWQDNMVDVSYKH